MDDNNFDPEFDVYEQDANGKVTPDQFKYLLDAIDGDPELKGNFSAANGKSRLAQKWTKLADELNQRNGGAIKDSRHWHLAYTNLKSRAKNALAAKAAYLSGTGGGPPQFDYDKLIAAGMSEVYAKCVMVAKLRINAFGNKNVLDPLQVQQQRECAGGGHHQRNNGEGQYRRGGGGHQRDGAGIQQQGHGVGWHHQRDVDFQRSSSVTSVGNLARGFNHRSSNQGYSVHSNAGPSGTNAVRYNVHQSPRGGRQNGGYRNSPKGHSRGGFTSQPNHRSNHNNSQSRDDFTDWGLDEASQADDLVMLSPGSYNEEGVHQFRNSERHNGPPHTLQSKRASASPARVDGESPARKRLSYGSPPAGDSLSTKMEEALLSLVTGMKELQTVVAENTAAVKNLASAIEAQSV